MIWLVLFLLVLSSLSLAQNGEIVDSKVNKEEDTCSGFSWLKCLLFGDASKRPVVGSAWYDRGISLPWYNPEGGALVGKEG